MDDGKVKDLPESEEDSSQDEEQSDSESKESEGEDIDDEPKEDIFDKYTIDPFLVRREATLLTLVRRAFH
jgi:hypothetical protein